jgi:hypothetical protein
MSVEPLKRPEGGAVITHSDITARREAERAEEEQHRQLAHLGRVAVLGEMTGTLAHELNQPADRDHEQRPGRAACSWPRTSRTSWSCARRSTTS